MEVSMGDLLIRNIADALKTDLDALADRTGRSLSETAKEVLRDGVEIAKKRLAAQAESLPLGQRLKAIYEGAFDSEAEAEEYQRYLDQLRKGAVGRPLPDFE
jgi:plasmid stability protein